MIDDDESLVGIMAIRLKQFGYRVDTSTVSTEGYNMALKQPYDIIILDVTMPSLNGPKVCGMLRTKGILTPILMLSGVTDKPNIVQCLELGADDYLTKPFSHTELIARLKALVRRNQKDFSVRWVNKHGLDLDTVKNMAVFEGRSMSLTKKESMLLGRLMNESPEPIARELLLKDVWGINYMHTSNRLDVYVRRLRCKLENIRANNLLHTVRGYGYYFDGADKDTRV